ncbi:hypothetical protein GJ496_003533 [Pomphorhynchus laevis]|nr:hypothetical protein GJ496_003533 [Pomphorhynchus laevis]
MPHYRGYRGQYSNTINPREEKYWDARNDNFEQTTFIPRSNQIDYRPTGRTRGRSTFRRIMTERGRKNDEIKAQIKPESDVLTGKLASDYLLNTERVDTYISEIRIKTGDIMTSPFTAKISNTTTNEIIPIRIAESAIISKLISELGQTGFKSLEFSAQAKLFWNRFKAATPNIVAAYESLCSVKFREAIIYLKPYQDLASSIAAVSTAQNIRLGQYLSLVPDFRLLVYIINNIYRLDEKVIQNEIIRRMTIVLPTLPIEGRVLQIGDIRRIIVLVPENRRELAAIRRIAINCDVYLDAANHGLTDLLLSYDYSILEEIINQQLRNIPANCLSQVNLLPSIKNRTNISTTEALITATAAAALSPFVNYENWLNSNVLNCILPFNTLYNSKGLLINSLYNNCSINVNQETLTVIGHGTWRILRKIEGRKGELIDDLVRLGSRVL